jgi:class 3 adenylate cyclase
MFCDLVGSTELSARLDPEDLRGVIAAYHRAVAEIVAGFDGFIGRYMGDGVLVYFGYPQAHEDDAERAVRAGLGAIDAVSRLDVKSVKLQARVGIATGLVVVGDLIGAGPAQEQSVVGETPNLAARLQALAQPDRLVIADSTRRQIGTLFDIEDLGPRTLSGFAEPQRAWRVVGESGVLSRFEALRSETTPLIGRDEELGLLLRRWREAKVGEGRIVLVSGEPGIGKSRLTAELGAHIANEPHTRLRYSCSPYHQDSALYPVLAQLERAAGFARSDTVEERLGKLRGLLARGARSEDEIALLAEALSLPSRAADLNLSPQRKREMLFEAELDQFEALAKRRPVLIVVEDAQWIDPTTRELLDLTLRRVRRLPVLLIITFRPEFQHGWSGQPHLTTLTLNRLVGRDGAVLVERLAGAGGLAHEIVDEIVERADGVPLFVEELTKAVLESANAGAQIRAIPPASLAVPATLHASLMARLDRLGSATKEIAQMGAAIGREFSYDLLAAIARRTEAQLREALGRLVDAGLVFQRGAPPEATFIFKHALVQDAAYSTLLRSQRQVLHACISKVLEGQFLDTVDTQPEILAHHFTQAGLVEPAIEFWHRAGVRNVRRSAHSEAATHFACALDLLDKLPPSKQRDERKLELTLALAIPLIAIHGFGSLRVEECALGAKELSDKLPTSSHRFAAQRVAWNSSLLRGAVPKTVALARDLFRLADADNSPAKLAVAHRALGYSLFITGELREGSKILDAGIALADTISDHEFTVYGEHPSMVCRLYSGQAKVLMGLPETGTRLIEAAIEHARHEKNAHSVAWALGVAAHSAVTQHDTDAAARFASEALNMAREHHLPQWRALAERCLGWTIFQLGECEAGLNLQQQGVRRWSDTGAMLHTTQCEVMLAESFLRGSRTAEARAHLGAARAHRAGYGENYLAAEIDLLEALLLQSEQAAAREVEGYLASALSIARRQEARLLELRTMTTLARILAASDERHKAVDLLAPIYGWFTEGFDTPDLKEAKALLDELG